MKYSNDIEGEIDTIRDKIYEEIKNMSPSEHTAYFNRKAEETGKKYNFRFVKSAAENVPEAAYNG
jgi:hypothetical protein